MRESGGGWQAGWAKAILRSLDPALAAAHRSNVDAFLKIVPVGDEFGLIFPDELLARLNVGVGDTLYLSETPGGALLLTTYDPEIEQPGESGNAASTRMTHRLA